jgi:hypothetical protein
MAATPKSCFLVIADLTGYSAYLSGSEIEHAPVIAGDLLEPIVGRLEPPFRPAKFEGRFSDGRHRRLHPEPCEAWGRRARLPDETWEAPVLAQVAGLRLDGTTTARVVASLGSAPRPIAIDRARIERRMRELAMDHVGGGIEDGVYLVRLAQLRAALAAIDVAPLDRVPAERSVAWLRALAETWMGADVREEKADLIHAIYERIMVAGRSFAGVRLTAAAYAHGFAVALPFGGCTGALDRLGMIPG